MATTWRRCHAAAIHRCHTAATLPPHRRHVAATLPPHCRHIQLWQPLWQQCGGNVAALWRRCIAATWHRRDVVAMSLSRRCHVVVTSSSCRRHVAMSSCYLCRVVVMLSSCHGNVVAMSAPPLPIRPAMGPPVPTRNVCPQAYRIYLPHTHNNHTCSPKPPTSSW